jgi:hypothetical protein
VGRGRVRGLQVVEGPVVAMKVAVSDGAMLWRARVNWGRLDLPWTPRRLALWRVPLLGCIALGPGMGGGMLLVAAMHDTQSVPAAMRTLYPHSPTECNTQTHASGSGAGAPRVPSLVTGAAQPPGGGGGPPRLGAVRPWAYGPPYPDPLACPQKKRLSTSQADAGGLGASQDLRESSSRTVGSIQRCVLPPCCIAFQRTR